MKNYKHLSENQYDWLNKYLNKPIDGKIRKLYLSNTDVINHLENNGFTLIKVNFRDKVFTYEKGDLSVFVCDSYMVIDKNDISMDVILTKN